VDNYFKERRISFFIGEEAAKPRSVRRCVLLIPFVLGKLFSLPTSEGVVFHKKRPLNFHKNTKKSQINNSIFDGKETISSER
jgi:hypothetical protein